MHILKRRSVAVAVFVLVVIASTLIGSHRSLNRVCRQAEDAFFDRNLLRGDGHYTCPGDQVKASLALANRLLSVIGTDGEWSEVYSDLVRARVALDEAMTARDIPAIAAANRSLTESVQAVERLVDAGAPLADSHDDYAAIVSDFASAQAVLDDSKYNEHVLAFRENVLAPFPANILLRLTGVKAPEIFP